jgi:sporulation protein YlmC with PRC-barrel domain
MNKLLAGISIATMTAASPAFAQSSPTAPSATNEKSTVESPASPTGSMKSPSTAADRTDKSTSTTTTTTTASSAAKTFSADSLMDANVRNAANENVGDVSDVVFDTSGKMTGIVVGVGGFLGIGERNVLIPFDQIQLQTGQSGDLVVMSNLTKESAKTLPEYRADAATGTAATGSSNGATRTAPATPPASR